jgi:Xaa-Pro aminopeptidase
MAKTSKGNSLGQYFIHGTSHHLGLDVHDAVSEPNRVLEPGMVITVEPGVYIPDENLGVRIEDVVLITESRLRIAQQGFASDARGN